MSYRNNEANTRKQIAKFSVDEWVEFRNRLDFLIKTGKLSERDEMILTELIVNMRSTAELAYLGRTDKNYSWLQSNQGKPMSVRRIQQILTEHFPEFHIQKTHKKNRAHKEIRKEGSQIRKIITPDSMCWRCGSKENLELHHILPVSWNGDNDERNLMILCHDCHRQISNYQLTIFSKMKKENLTPLDMLHQV